ncbi:Rieske 2Fe-2S domain-containing protein [Noviherbaspirillum malthae]|uniref:Rieske 2Fe-2S domain-containing protein n=1 Tax=Noviherbaspirillum malthae TaxID=1260987 RepID=UPI00188E4CA2|nr:Rieske 2Fe-2S domain-containing protein [Noviherbaspirillum malthae]
MDMPETKHSTPASEFLKEFPKTGPGTLAGAMLRQYWHPICLSEDLKDLPYPVRMLGEDLVAFRAYDGSVNLVDSRCPHRRASLAYGQIKENGLSCSYHGWTFDGRGRCVDTPLEPERSRLKEQVKHPWYPAQEWGGIVWGYMGTDKENPPPLPKIDILARTDGELVVQRGDVRNYNYQNFLENFADMGHVYVLHMLAPGSAPEEIQPYCDMSVNTDWRKITHRCFETDYGMKSVLVHDTATPDKKFVNTWSIAMPFYWRFGGISAGLPPDFTDDRRESGGMLRIIDDGHFEIFRYTLIRPGNFRSTFYPRASDVSRGLAEGISGLGEKKDYDYRKYPAWEGLPPVEDLVIQESQGVIPDRESEYLASSDIGVSLLRRLWRKSMEAVAQGEKPKTIPLDADGIFKVDTYKGFANQSELRLSSENMPSSEDGRGLIRDSDGNPVFTDTAGETK